MHKEHKLGGDGKWEGNIEDKIDVCLFQSVS